MINQYVELVEKLERLAESMKRLIEHQEKEVQDINARIKKLERIVYLEEQK